MNAHCQKVSDKGEELNAPLMKDGNSVKSV